jgi:hypothetical protein
VTASDTSTHAASDQIICILAGLAAPTRETPCLRARVLEGLSSNVKGQIGLLINRMDF